MNGLITHHTKVQGRSAQSYAADANHISVDLQIGEGFCQPNEVLLGLALPDAKALHALLGLAIRDAEEAAA